jgi:hypothetical protein
MADNTVLNAGTGGDTIASDDIAGVKFQRVKLTLGADGVNDGDVASGNALPVSAASLPLPAGASTLAEQQTQTTALQLIDDVVHSGDAAPAAVTENQAQSLRMTSSRGLHANLRTAAGAEIGTAGSPVRVDPTGTTTQPISAATLPLPTGASTLTEQQTQTTALQLLDDTVFVDNAAFTDATSKLNAVGFYFDETAGTALTENDIAAARIDSKRAQVLVIEDETTRGRRATVTAANALKVDGSAVTQPVSGTVTANLAAGTNTNEVVGDAANDTAISGNPLSVGGRASIAIPTAAGADGRNFYAWLDLAGALFTRQRPAASSAVTNVASSATNVTLLAANNARVGAFIFNDSTQALLVKLAATASLTSFSVRLAPGAFWEVPAAYRGIIDGIWQSTQGSARITELTS